AYSNITQQERRAAKASAHSRKTAKQGYSLAESEEFIWPMPGKQSSQLVRSETPRAKQRRRKASLAVASDGEFLGMPPQAEELLELGMPDLGSVAGGLGRQAICTFKSLMIAAMKMCYILVTTAVSMYCAVSYSLPLASLIIGVVDGLAAGVANVKAVLNRSCLPGYLQSITVFVTLPGILFVLVFFSQVGGSPLLSGSMCCLAVWRALDFKAGEVAIDIKSRKKLAKAIERVKVDTSGAKDAIVQKLQNPLAMTRAICKLVYVRVFTKVVTTNWILEAVFDAADDHLKVKILAKRVECPIRKEQGSAVEESWAKLTQNKRKKDEFTTDEEGGYYDSEGWYYPPPGEEGLGEVPDMPPAVEGIIGRVVASAVLVAAIAAGACNWHDDCFSGAVAQHFGKINKANWALFWLGLSTKNFTDHHSQLIPLGMVWTLKEDGTGLQSVLKTIRDWYAARDIDLNFSLQTAARTQKPKVGQGRLAMAAIFPQVVFKRCLPHQLQAVRRRTGELKKFVAIMVSLLASVDVDGEAYV
ncbi:unnamed protein product, partial [Symbiodinium microadriaticum]